MCWLNTSSPSPRKFPRPCATSRRIWRTRRRPLPRTLKLGPFLLLLLLILNPTSLLPAQAQGVERSELPPLPGTAPADFGGPSSPPTPDFPAPPSLIPQTSAGTDASALPHDLWRGVDAEALQRLLAAV